MKTKIMESLVTALAVAVTIIAPVAAVGSGGSSGGGSASGGTTSSLDHTFSMVSTGLATSPGVVPGCIADLRIRPVANNAFWNQASLTVSVVSLNLPDYSYVWVLYTQTGSTRQISCNVISPILSGAGNKNVRFYIEAGTTLTSVSVTDSMGRLLFTGQ